MTVPRLGYKLLGALLLLYTVVWGFLGTVPPLQILNETIRVLYFHVPMWFSMMLTMGVSAVMSILYLRTRKAHYDIWAMETARVGTLVGILGLVTGAIWANYTWGEPWSNDPKQQNSAIALLIYFGYLVLHGSFTNTRQGARIGAVYNVFAFALLIPLLFILPRMQQSLHPGADGNPAFKQYDLDNNMRAVFYPAVVAWMLVSFWVIEVRVRMRRLELARKQSMY